MNIQARRTQGGFTLIELVIVIVILGILAAVAVPRFIDLSDEAESAAVQGVAGAMASAMAINFAGCSAKSHDNSASECTTISDCDQVGSILEGGIPTNYVVPSTGLGSNGATASCTVFKDQNSNGTADAGEPTATFSGIGAGQ